MNVKLNIFIFSIFTDFQTRVLDRYFYQLLIYKFWSVVGLDKKVFLFKLFLFCRKFGQHPSDNHDNFFFAKHTHDNSRAVSRQQAKCGGSSKEGRARACMGNPNVQKEGPPQGMIRMGLLQIIHTSCLSGFWKKYI